MSFIDPEFGMRLVPTEIERTRVIEYEIKTINFKTKQTFFFFFSIIILYLYYACVFGPINKQKTLRVLVGQ